MFANPFPHAFGLDISDLSLKLVQLRNVSRGKHPSFSLETFRSVSLPHGLIVNGELIKPEEVRKLLDILVHGEKKTNKKGIKGNWVVASLPESQSFIKLITLDKPYKQLVESDILLAAQKHIPFDPNSYYIDWHVVPMAVPDPNRTHIFIGAISKQIANSYTYLLESVGLGVIAIELEALAVARSMITASKVYHGEARAILDVGGTRTSLLVYDHDSIQFSTSLPFSGELVTTALMQSLGISYEEAEQRKRERGLDYQQDQGQGFTVLSDMVSQLIEEIQKAIHFYYTHFSHSNKITHITMCGGSANLKHLPDILTEQLGIEAVPGRAWKNLNTQKKIPLDPFDSLAYSAAIGLALRAADNPFSSRDII